MDILDDSNDNKLCTLTSFRGERFRLPFDEVYRRV